MSDVFTVRWAGRVDKQLGKLPANIVRKFHVWVDMVHLMGLMETRKVSGFHDEPLHGRRHGQRSIRLNIAYRAIYEVKPNGNIRILEVLEITKHDY